MTQEDSISSSLDSIEKTGNILSVILRHVSGIVIPSNELSALWRLIFSSDTQENLEKPKTINRNSLICRVGVWQKRSFSRFLQSAMESSSSNTEGSVGPVFSDSGIVPNEQLIPTAIFRRLMVPSNASSAWLDLAIYYLKSGMLEESARCLVAAIELRKGVSLRILLASARLFQCAEIPTAALWAVVSTLRRNPADRDATLLAAQLAQTLGHDDELVLLQGLHDIVSYPGPITIALASCYLRRGDRENAKCLLATVELEDQNTYNYRWLTAKLLKEEADLFSRATLLEHTAFSLEVTPDACLAIGRELAEIGQYNQAEKCLIKGLSLDASNATRRALLAEISAFPFAKAKVRSLPLVLISQIQRSGGTLLSQLLDGHPEVLVHPHEIHIGTPKKWIWPELDLSKTPLEWLSTLFEYPLVKLILEGYRKPDRNSEAAKHRFPFELHVAKLCSSFVSRVQDKKNLTQRDILNAYFDSFFDSWDGYPETGQEKWIGGFTPRLLLNYGSLKRFWNDYPDGVLIAIVRNPFTWFASSRRHDKSYEPIENAIELWRCSTLSALVQAQVNPTRFHLMTYESLVKNTVLEMRVLAHRLGISFTPTLLEPTFRGMPILPNSSYIVSKYGIHQQSLGTANLLSESERSYIKQEAFELYVHAKQVADTRTKEIIQHANISP